MLSGIIGESIIRPYLMIEWIQGCNIPYCFCKTYYRLLYIQSDDMFSFRIRSWWDIILFWARTKELSGYRTSVKNVRERWSHSLIRTVTWNATTISFYTLSSVTFMRPLQCEEYAVRTSCWGKSGRYVWNISKCYTL